MKKKKQGIDELNVTKKYDKRIKLTKEEESEIKELHKNGMAIKAIARLFIDKCSRRKIQFTLFPEREALCKKQFRERRKDGRYKPTKTDWNETIKKHRDYKRKLKNDNLI